MHPLWGKKSTGQRAKYAALLCVEIGPTLSLSLNPAMHFSLIGYKFHR